MRSCHAGLDPASIAANTRRRILAAGAAALAA
jgi:hypothetical protein